MKFGQLFSSKIVDNKNKKSYRHPLFSTVYSYANGQPIWSDGGYAKFSEQGYIRNVIANYCVSSIASAISSVPLQLFQYYENGKRTLISHHKILDLINKPNPFLSGSSFMEQIVMHYLIGGNAYIAKVRDSSGAMKELYGLRPDRVTLTIADERPKSFRYVVGNNVREYPINSLTGQCDALQIKNFHPTNDVYGLSAFESASYSIDQHNEACVWNQSLLKNSARPSGALVVKGDDNCLTEEQYQKLKGQIDDLFSGYNNCGRPILLEGGLDWKEMSLNPRDMDFVNAKQNMSRDIALSFGVPSYLLGIPGDNTYSNLAEARLAFWENTVMPLLNKILNYMNNWFAYDFPDVDLRLECDCDKISIFSDQREQLWNRLNTITFMTINEKRALLGLEPIIGGDTIAKL